VCFLRSIRIWLRNGINHIAAVSSILVSFRLLSWLSISSISWSTVEGDCCYIRAPLCIPKFRSLSSLLRSSSSLCCRSSYISWTFRASSSRRTSICLAPSIATILDFTASFSLLNIRVLGSSATAPIYSITCLWYSTGSPHINNYPFSCLVRFPTATALAEIVVKSYT